MHISLVRTVIILSLHTLLFPAWATPTSVSNKTITIDGSSTVYPISEAVAEEFSRTFRHIRVTVGISGTGGGFKKFLAGEIDINNASRRIKPSEEIIAKNNGISFIEIPIAYDGISIVVNARNDWADDISVDELHKLWKPNSQVKTWHDLRDDWPNKPIRLFAPGTDSGTFDYFTKAINGETCASRYDYTASENDNMLVQGVAGEKYSLGYFGYAYFAANQKKLKVLSVIHNNIKVKPSTETIYSGAYQPLSRKVYIYVNSASLHRANMLKFMQFYLQHATGLVKDVGYTPLRTAEYNQISSLISMREN